MPVRIRAGFVALNRDDAPAQVRIEELTVGAGPQNVPLSRHGRMPERSTSTVSENLAESIEGGGWFKDIWFTGTALAIPQLDGRLLLRSTRHSDCDQAQSRSDAGVMGAGIMGKLQSRDGLRLVRAVQRAWRKRMSTRNYGEGIATTAVSSDGRFYVTASGHHGEDVSHGVIRLHDRRLMERTAAAKSWNHLGEQARERLSLVNWTPPRSNLAKSTLKWERVCTDAGLNASAFNPNGSIVSVGGRRVVCLYEVDTGTRLRTIDVGPTSCKWRRNVNCFCCWVHLYLMLHV